MALIKCFGGPAEVIFGFDPQCTRYSIAICIRKSAFNFMQNSRLLVDCLVCWIWKLSALSKHEMAPDLLPLTRHSIIASKKQCSANLVPPARFSVTNSSCCMASSNISCLMRQQIIPQRGSGQLLSSWDALRQVLYEVAQSPSIAFQKAISVKYWALSG